MDGLDVRDYPLDQLRSRIGMVLQNNVLFSGTIRENLLWGNENATEEELVQAAKDAQAYDFIMSFPDAPPPVMAGWASMTSNTRRMEAWARVYWRTAMPTNIMDIKICMQKALDHLNETVQENLIAVRVVKSYVREDRDGHTGDEGGGGKPVDVGEGERGPPPPPPIPPERKCDPC